MRRSIGSWFLLSGLLVSQLGWAVTPDQKNLPIEKTRYERTQSTTRSSRFQTPAPVFPVHSLGEWEESASAMTLWSNPSLVKALSENGNVTLLADSDSEVSWWKSWLTNNTIEQTKIDYFVVPTDSIWIRDYGPWFIVDGNGDFGLVDMVYNRPRPKDDLVPQFIAKKLNIPLYAPDMVHTGGNYYSDGYGNAFSSRLVYSENESLSESEVNQRMHDYLGITRYTTSDLGAGITIEHLDTFGKLVAPDTFVIGEFPAGTSYATDVDRLIEKIKRLKTPYGNSYKIFRMKMIQVSSWSTKEYRAYINSFISNKTLYFPTYGNDANDQAAKAVYQQALPGYKIVGVDNANTKWGDSVHCRTRNVMQSETIFMFPTASIVNGGLAVKAKIIASPRHMLVEAPRVWWKVDNGRWMSTLMNVSVDGEYEAFLDTQLATRLESGLMEDGNPSAISEEEFDMYRTTKKVSFYIKAADDSGKRKTAPFAAPQMTIDFEIP